MSDGIFKVADVHVVRMMCGQVECTHCGHKQSAQGYHHDQGKIPLSDYSVRCNNCGNPLPPKKGNEH